MAGPNSYTVQTQQRQAAGQLPGLQQIKGAGPATRPATTAQAGSISYVGSQAAEQSVAERYNNEGNDKTAQWLLKVAGNLVEPYVQAEQQNMMMQGIQDVAAGKSMDEIKAEQPWYSRIFGDSDVVTAARAYTAQRSVSDAIGQIQQAIPNIQNMTPAQARDFMTQTWQSFNTGDVLTDSVANQQFLNAAPGLFEQWQKQNYKNLQEQAKASQQSAQAGLIGTYGLKAKSHGIDGTVSTDDLLKAQGEMLSGMAPVEGQDFGSWMDNIVNSTQQAAQSGNFHAVNAIEQSGLLNNLPPQQRAAMRGFIQSQQNIKTSEIRITPEYASEIGSLQLELRTGSMTPAEVLVRTQQLNQKAQAEFGFTQPMIAPDEVAGWMNVSTDLVANEINRQRNADMASAKRGAEMAKNVEAKQAVELREAQIASNRVSSGGLIPSGESTETIQKVGLQTFQAMEGQAPGSGYVSLVNLYANNNGLVLTGPQAKFTAMLNLADKTEWTPEFDAGATAAFTAMTSVPGGQNAAIKYFGADGTMKMNNYLAAMKNGVPQPMAYHEAFVQPERLGDPGTVNKADRDAIASELEPSWYASFFKSPPGASSQARIMQSAQAHYANLKTNARYTDDGERVTTAINMAMHDGNLAIYGKWAWDRDKTAPQLHEQVQVQPDQLYGILSSQLASQPQFEGLDLDNASFIERYDGNGQSTIMSYIPDGKGKFRVGITTSADLRQHRDDLIKEQKKERSFFAGAAVSPSAALGFQNPARK